MLVGRRGEDEIAQVAWLYHVGRLSQQEVSDRLGISRFKVLRMLADARDHGLVRITLEHRSTANLALADRLAAVFGLREVLVAPVPPTLDDDEYRLRAVGMVAASYLARIAAGDRHQIIGVGWGRTLSAMADHLVAVSNPNLTFVSLMGSVAHASHTAPVEVCVRLAALTGGRAVLLPAPFVADSAEACEVILSQRLVRETIEIARRADHTIMSVGECAPGAVLFESGLLSDDQIATLRGCGVVGDCCGNFFLPDGSLADCALNRCTPCVGIDDLGRSDVAVTAGGVSKAEATLAVLRAGFVSRLMVDETLAGVLLDTA